jgi:branched-subunit amino acid transport protein
MRHLALVLIVATITFASRYFFFVQTRSVKLGRFLDVFPVALFVAIGAQHLLDPESEFVLPNLAALIGAGLGGLLFKRSMLGVVLGGLALYWAIRLAI